MTLTFISNYINHHQIPVSDLLYQELGEDYHFLQTEPMDEERKKMGWHDGVQLPYLVCSYDQPELAGKLLMDSDVVIFGGCEDQELIIPRLRAGKPVIRCSERIYKEGQWKFITPRGLRQKYHDHIRYRKQPVYMLCAGAYVASDFHLIHAYPDKMLRWGYFPPFIAYEEDDCHRYRHRGIEENEVPTMLWAGRFMEWKQPEVPIQLMKTLRDEGIACQLQMIGGGELEERLHQLVHSYGLTDCISFSGFLSPEEVRTQMEQADIYLFTSDYHEGWGAVLNEAMNSGCAVITDSAIGAAPFLIEHGKNGYLYKDGDMEALAGYARELIANQEKRLQLGKCAYETIRDLWNPQVAARELLALCTQLWEQGEIISCPKQGPGSRAEIISPGFWS